MKWYSTLHASSSLERALRAAARDVRSRLQSDRADLGMLFISSAYRADVVDLWPVLKEELQVKHLLGCTGGGVIGGGREVEEQPAVSLTAAILPDVEITPFVIQQDQLPTPDAGPRQWRDLVKTTPEKNPSFLILSDPFSLDADSLVAGLDFAFPNAVKVGGLASGGMSPNENLIMCDEKILSKGAVGVSLSGDVFVEAVVAQGCRPIGEPMTITESDGNVLIKVNGQPPLTYIQDLYAKLTPRDQELIQTSLFLGLLMDPFKNDPKQGDFLIRNIIGLDQKKGMLAIGAGLRAGQTVQFHLRDADTSREDLNIMLSKSQSSQLRTMASGNPSESAAMLFSCLGRGKRLYGEVNHDSMLLKSVMGDIPVGGFFCNGEIGPVGGKTYLHGYTSSIAVFSPKKNTTKPGAIRALPFLLLGSLLSTPVFAQKPIEPPANVIALQDAFAKVVEAVKPAVVNISAVQITQIQENPVQFFYGGPDEFFQQFYGQDPRAIPQPREYRREGTGSGVLINAEGFILTNNHVVQGADELNVTLYNDKVYKGKVVGTDPRTDLAVIRIKDKAPFAFVPMGDSSKARIGDWVLAFGSPFGLEQTVTSGIVSAIRQSLAIEGKNFRSLLQTDAAINRGNSGGAMVNLRGELIGINTAIYAPTGVFSGIGFAIPVNDAKVILKELIEKGYVERSWMGVEIAAIDPELASRLGLKSTEGAIIANIVRGSPADKAGLKPGDVVTEFNSKKTTTVQALQDQVAMTPPGKKVGIKIIRNGVPATLTLKTEPLPRR